MHWPNQFFNIANRVSRNETILPFHETNFPISVNIMRYDNPFFLPRTDFVFL